jgi:hypothetical protein
MVVTILAEPRSGSTNLAKWFTRNKNFTVLFEPFNRYTTSYKFGESPKLWKYITKHFLVKEIYNKYHPQNKELLDISDKVIILHRESDESQKESWINAFITGNWDKSWSHTTPKKLPDDIISGLYDIKSSLKSDFIDCGKYFTISYEELYYNNGFQRIVDYINLPEVQNIDFPYGTKYRVDSTIDKLI